MGSIVSKTKKPDTPESQSVRDPAVDPTTGHPPRPGPVPSARDEQPSRQPGSSDVNDGPKDVSSNNGNQPQISTDEPVSVEDISLDEWLSKNLIHPKAVEEEAKQREVGTWIEIRLFISSTFIDTHSERDILVQRVIPSINRKLASKFIRVIPVDLRWGVLADESKNCEEIQKTCLNQIDKCRQDVLHMPWFLGIRTDRYGWVQDNYLSENGFEQPKLYEWIKRFDSYGKKVSITSLEAIQASQSGKVKHESPTVFFYKRNIVPQPTMKGKKYPDEFRWIFEFEYVENEIEDPKLKYQYNVNPNAAIFEQDRDALNKFIQEHPQIKWFEYDAQYRDAKITCQRENAKSFGVGYVDKLEKFESQVEEDLMEAILSNYTSVDTMEVDKYATESIQHENAVKFKASTFVGRTELIEKGFDHCSSVGYPNTLILHGEPGCGKSGLLAKLVVQCMNKIENDFLFVHAVDTCPGSNVLEGMMTRLQTNLRKYRRDMGETKLSREFTGNASELKQEHHSFLIESANKYPSKLFIIFIDAVNQFHSGLGAWDMWWLPPKDAPKNLKFMISTLNEENGTFKNACNVAPEAICLPVQNMSSEDLQEMVKMTLARFNKKLTEDDDPILGNQMQNLLSKSKSPLYLVAACEALRKFGIFEKVTQYIESLPNTITELFSFLLEEWSRDYGKLFVEDVAGLLCVSKDGLLENQINDVLHFKEQREKGDGEFLYEANFPRIYDSIAHFLAAGGGGYLRFFHDQLKYAVRREFLTESFEQETHMWMRDFLQEIVIKQCCQSPPEEPPAYFEHVLGQLVYHQLKAHQNQESPMESLKTSLRNIHFVKHRIVANQHQSLSDEYSLALDTLTNNEDLDALKQWASFVQLYTTHIREFPNFSLNMAITQAPTSYVMKDTIALAMEPFEKGVAYPLYWANISAEGDPMLVKYPQGGIDCSATDTQGDIVAIGDINEVVILDQSSGELIHNLDILGSAVSLLADGKTLIVGDSKGTISQWDVCTATMEKSVYIFEEAPFIAWVECTEDYLLAGSGSNWKALWQRNSRHSWIAVVDKNSFEVVKKWCTEKPGFDCCYNGRLEMIFSAHLDGEILGWDLQGNKLCSAKGGGDVIYCISCHPIEDKIVSGSNDLVIREWSVTKTSLEIFNQIQDTTKGELLHSGNWSVCYDHNGERILSTEPESKSLRIYNLAGELLEELRGHSECINMISLVPGGHQVLTSDNGQESILWELPDTKVVKKDSSQMVQEKVKWCAFTVDGTQFLTATTGFTGWLRLYDTATLELKASKETCNHYQMSGAIHPDGKHVIVFSSAVQLACFAIINLEMVSEHQALVAIEENSLTCMALDKTGSNLLVTDSRVFNSEHSVAKVLDVSDVKTFKEKLTIEGYGGRLVSCAINNDGDLGCICGHKGIRIFELTSGKTKYQIDRKCSFVKFFSSNCLLYANASSFYKYDPKSEQDVCAYKGHTDRSEDAIFLNDEKQIMTVARDGTLRIFDAETGENIYGFFNHRAQGYTSLASHPSGRTFLAANDNSIVYILKTSREDV